MRTIARESKAHPLPTTGTCCSEDGTGASMSSRHSFHCSTNFLCFSPQPCPSLTHLTWASTSSATRLMCINPVVWYGKKVELNMQTLKLQAILITVNQLLPERAVPKNHLSNSSSRRMQDPRNQFMVPMTLPNLLSRPPPTQYFFLSITHSNECSLILFQTACQWFPHPLDTQMLPQDSTCLTYSLHLLELS